MAKPEKIQGKESDYKTCRTRPAKKIGKYAFEFVHMGRDEEKRLVEIIYNIQRSFLQRKL